MPETPAAVDFVLLVFAISAMATVVLFTLAAIVVGMDNLIRWGRRW